ncbi:MAG: lysylphosphatidylglycerol synthase transmembrane domain-containing protein [Candidatus Eisenbacteria bacterium]
MKRAIQLIIGLAISGVAIWYSSRDVKLPELLQALRSASLLGFFGVMVVTIFGFWLRAVRWRLFLRTPRKVSTLSLFSSTMIGFMANNVLPFRLGEFVRPWALSRREGLSKSMLIATVVVERAIDMMTLLAIFGVSLMLHPIGETTDAGRMVQGGAKVLIVLSGMLTVMVIVAERNRALAHRMLGLLPLKIRGRASELLDRFLDGFALFRDFGKLAQAFAMSFAMFMCFAVALALSMWSLGIVAPWYAGLVMLVVTAIGIMVPAAPGYVGTLNYACVVGLKLFDVDPALAAAFGWFYFFSQWLPITAVGLYYLNREGLSLASLGKAKEVAKEEIA